MFKTVLMGFPVFLGLRYILENMHNPGWLHSSGLSGYLGYWLLIRRKIAVLDTSLTKTILMILLTILTVF